MNYEILYTEKAVRQLKKLDKSVLVMIKAWIDKNLIGANDPRRFGKALTGDKIGWWRYRVGDYRILADIQDDKLVILVIEVGHRSSVYR